MLKDFKEFIAKGNVMDLAVAVIIAGAFALIVASMTADIIMPVVGAIFGNVDFSDKYIVLAGEVEQGMSLEAAREAGANVLAWGNFVSTVINFVILAFVIFLTGVDVADARQAGDPIIGVVVIEGDADVALAGEPGKAGAERRCLGPAVGQFIAGSGTFAELFCLVEVAFFLFLFGTFQQLLSHCFGTDEARNREIVSVAV